MRVLKIGGSSLKSIDDYTNLARKIYSSHRRGEGPTVVVISAAYGQTSQLWEEAEELYTDRWLQVEYVALEGEFISAHVMQRELLKLGAKAKFISPLDIDLRATGNDPENCTLLGADPVKFNREVTHSPNDVVVIPGYVGVHDKKRSLAALGRNSTDLIAVEVARCSKAPLYFVKSAPTVYAVSPELVEDPEEIPDMTYEQALRFLEYLPQSNQFIMRRAVELAWKKKVELVFGSLNDEKETKITASPNGRNGSEFKAMPVKKNVAIVNFRVFTDNKTRAQLFRKLHEKNIQFFDTNETEDGPAITFNLSIEDERKYSLVDAVKEFAILEDVEVRDASLITLIDTSLDPESHHSSMVTEAFEDTDINVLLRGTSGVIMHIYVAPEDTRRAVKILAEKFALTKNAE